MYLFPPSVPTAFSGFVALSGSYFKGDDQLNGSILRDNTKLRARTIPRHTRFKIKRHLFRVGHVSVAREIACSCLVFVSFKASAVKLDFALWQT